MKRYLSVKEFQDVFGSLSVHVQEQETNLRAKTAEIELMMMEMKEELEGFHGNLEGQQRNLEGLQRRASSPKTSTHLLREIGQLQEDVKRLEINLEQKIQKEVRDLTAAQMEMDANGLNNQYPGGMSEDVLNEVLKTSSNTTDRVTSAELTIKQMGEKVNLIDAFKNQIVRVGNQVQMMKARYAEEVKSWFKDQEEVIKTEMQNTVQRDLGVLEKRIVERVSKTDKGRIDQLMKTSQKEITEFLESQGKYWEGSKGSATLASLRTLEGKVEELDQEMIEQKNNE